MRHRAFVLGSLATLLACAYAQGNGKVSWVGVWQGELDGQPGVTLTLAQDTGDLGGTIVLNGVSREGSTPHVIVSEPHVLLHPRVDGNTLSFQVKRPPDSQELRIEVKFSDGGKAQMRCLNCGPDSPTTELLRINP
jgi:hypothetical protein